MGAFKRLCGVLGHHEQLPIDLGYLFYHDLYFFQMAKWEKGNKDAHPCFFTIGIIYQMVKIFMLRKKKIFWAASK